MEDKNDFKNSVENLLINEDFIKWRIFNSKEQNEYWSNFRNQNPHLSNVLDEAITQFEKVKINYFPLSTLEKKLIYKNINGRLKQHERRMWLIRTGYVAAVFIIGVCSILFLRTLKQNDNNNIYYNKDIIMGQALPEEDVYILSNGKKTNLADKSHIGLKEDGKAIITDSTSSKKELLLAKTELNKLVVPYGKRTNISLADGTEVWLNSGTQLDFPTEFRGNTRNIFVNGEIYIDVASDTNKPFIVHAGEMNVIVQGTSFNISSYNDDSSKSVVLVEGQVKIETENNYQTELAPNERLVISNNTVSKEIVDVLDYVSWKDGMLVFNSTPMSEILKRIGRYYNVEFENTQEVTLNDKSLSGKLFLSNNLDSVLTSISAISSTEYLREENKIFISSK